MNRPKTPAHVELKLRQEAGFGCAACGCPITDYHHIIEWSEKPHFDVADMVALCPNHHREFGKRAAKHAYRLKQNPHNLKFGRIKGFLGGNGIQKAIRMGGMLVKNCNSVLAYSKVPIFSYRMIDGEINLSAFLPNEHFWPEIEVHDNSISAILGDFWDIEFKTNWIKFRRAKGDIFLEIDFRGENVTIDGNFSIRGQQITLSKTKSLIGTNTITNAVIENCDTAMMLGPNGRLLKPNYAMTTPCAIFLPSGNIWDPRKLK